MSERQSWPTEIRLRNDRRSILIRFEDGTEYDLPAEYLRVLSPSAEVQGHAPDQRKTVPGKIDVAITAIDPVGNYAIRPTFSDGHDSGLFTWAYLRRLGEENSDLWSAYLADLERQGLSRESRRPG
ncbi:MAG: DUF971 domain-containing protein [Bauldia sp.]|uniref:DUF971 domain-containing protein n=1 Tax=Bauldia sp. TaxID=2575872 RepID=UPI001DA152EC|nr:DUF971 domain-containing protein [Bauldia sp.]MCB1496373.1 DUF971 domain-containing protein [Bauldia sp.]